MPNTIITLTGPFGRFVTTLLDQAPVGGVEQGTLF